jgi:hypothetical protein
MQLSTQLVSVVLTGVAVAAVVAAVVGRRDWRHDGRSRREGSASVGDHAARLASRAVGSQFVWMLTFLALAFGLGGAVVVFLAGGPMSATAGLAVAALGATALLVFLAVGTYRTVRFRGRSSAGAAAVTVWTMGALGVLAVVVRLLLG